MDIKNEIGDASGLKLGLGLLAVGIAIGLVARPRDWMPEDPDADETEQEVAPVELGLPMSRGNATAGSPETTPEGAGLETLWIEVEPRYAEVLQRKYDRSMESGMIIKGEDDLVPATLRHGDLAVTGDVRIKGDYLDHLRTDKWSLRIECKSGKLFGMSRFSIQHPMTRGYLWEWLVMKAARRYDILAPRVDFVNVVINDNPLGIYYLEEHFTKELIESQGRREGPIVRFDERVLMSVYEQYGFQQITIPETVRPGTLPTTAEVTAYGEKRIGKSENLSRELQQAIDKLGVLQDGVQREVHGRSSRSTLKKAADRLQEMTLESSFDFDSVSRMHALLALFRCKHGMGWKDRHFYFNPITDRLEPILCDTLAGTPIAERDPVTMYTHTNQVFLRDDAYYNELFLSLAEVASPAFLTGMFDELEEDLRLYGSVMRAEGMDHPGTDVDGIKSQLFDQQIYLRDLLRPNDPVNFDCRLLSEGGPGGELAVEVWATTRVPVVLRGFYFENGRFVAARRVVDGETSGNLGGVPSDPDAVVLPNDSRRVLFRFPADWRLATLLDVQAIKSAITSATEKDESEKVRITAEYRLLTDDILSTEELSIRRFGSSWAEEGGRPAPPSLEEALAAHEFLTFDLETRELVVTPGEWNVIADLVVPVGHPLRVGPGTTLRFGGGAALISTEPLSMTGSESAPIVLEPAIGVGTWSGVTVLEADGKSVWRNVHVKRTDAILRGGWMMTGGVTFYRCPVELYDCRFEDAAGEDALNIYGTEFIMDGVVVDTCASDAFDGDFVTGVVRNSTFINSVEDAVDVSGSDIDVEDCRFVDIGDKAISAGERSVVRARDCVVESASIGLASKDASRLFADRIDIQRTINYGIAVFVKKPEYGPSSVIANEIAIGESGRGPHIVQLPCKLILDGQPIRGELLDVKELYRQKILGQ